MGQALPALFNKLPNGDVLIHAYGDFVAADGTGLEGRGVVPDVAVAARLLLAGKDETLEAALDWIAGRRGPGERKVRPKGGLRVSGCTCGVPLLDSFDLRYLRKLSFPSQPTRKSSGSEFDDGPAPAASR